MRDIEVLYTPTYSPDFNPAEFVFNKMRSVMHYHLWDLTNENIELAVYEAAGYITSHDMANFFRYTNKVFLCLRRVASSIYCINYKYSGEFCLTRVYD